MKKTFLCLICCLVFAGCGSSSIPEWKNLGFNQLENFKTNYLSGKQFIAETNFRKATDEIKRSGDLDILAKAYLTKFGVQTALMEVFKDDEYLDVEEVLPNPEYMNFFNFLRGVPVFVDGTQLPPRYRGVFKALQNNDLKDLETQISRIDDPLSRLIATGVAVKQKRYTENMLKAAVDTASANGWRKALLVYLGQLQIFYENGKQLEKADKTRKTIQLLK